MRYAICFGIVLAAIAPSATLCPAAPPVDEATRAAQVIVQLNDVDSVLRRQASLQLNSLGAEALPVVEKAAASGENRSPEQRLRLKKALTILRPRARDMTLRNARRDWLRKIFVDAYTAGGHTNAKWDAQAGAAIDAYLASSLNPAGNTQPLIEAAFNTAKAATDLGCDDPLVYALYRLHAVGEYSEQTDKVGAWGTVRGNLKVATYPAILLLWLDVDADRMRPSPISVVTRDWASRLEQISKDGSTSPERGDFLGRRMYRAMNPSGDPMPQAAAEFLVEYKRLFGKTIGTLLCDSDVLFKEISADMLTRTGGQVFTTPEDWRGEGGLLAKAEKINIEAEALDPTDPRPSAELVRIKMLQIDATREDFDRVFQHAVSLNPDNYTLFDRRMDYLKPEWRGNRDELLAFGRECMETENWRAGIPMTFIKIHEYLADHTADPDTYFTERGVREDIRDVFGPHLLNFPDDVKTRCNYAHYAMRCDDWATAKAQFDIIGDKFDRSVFPSQGLYEHDREKAARLAQSTPGKA